MSDEQPPLPARGDPMFQISGDDLAELERILPEWQIAMFDRLDARTKTQIRRVQQILMNVRWDYGPPQEVEVIPADDL